MKPLAVACLALLGLPALGFGQDWVPYPDNRAGHWAYNALFRMRKDGIVSFQTGMYLGSWLLTYPEFVAWTFAAAGNIRVVALQEYEPTLQRRISDLDARIDALETGPPNATELSTRAPAMIPSLAELRLDVRDLLRMVDVFGADMKSMGLDPIRAKQELIALDRKLVAWGQESKPTPSSGDDDEN